MPRKPDEITRIYMRTYTDTGQKTLYVDWSNGSCTECDAERACSNEHMRALVDAAQRKGLTLENEVW